MHLPENALNGLLVPVSECCDSETAVLQRHAAAFLSSLAYEDIQLPMLF